MTSLIEYSKTISFSADPANDDIAEETIVMFVERIETHKPRSLKRIQNGIFYTAGVMRFVTSFNLLYCISEGEIKVEKKGKTLVIHYVIRFYELIALSIIPIVGVMVAVEPLVEKIIVLVLFILVGYVGNVLTTIVRYRRFIRNTINDLLSRKDVIVMSEEQKGWIGNPGRCDACGYAVSSTDTECPDCGLRLR